MRYCHNCHRLTAGKPIFCNYCGRSFDVKLCSKMHVNPRAAQACSQCGSKELSSPQPKIPMLLRPLIVFLQLGPGGLLVVGLLVWFVLYVNRLLNDPSSLLSLMLIAVLIGLFLVGWMKSHGKDKHKK